MVYLVYGFIGYSRQVFNDSGDEEYVHALHCDQSSIECLFSHVRASGKDRVDLCGLEVMSKHIYGLMKCTRAKIKYKIYPGGVPTTDTLITGKHNK